MRLFVVTLFFLILPSLSAEAFLRIRPPGLGILLLDKNKPFSYDIFSPTTFDGISHDEFLAMLRDKYKQWSDVINNQISTNYLGLTTKEIEYIPNHAIEAKDTDNIQTHRVVKERWSDLALSTSAVAVTLLVNDKETIVDIDIVYNEEKYNFCKDIGTCKLNEIHLPTIVLHELGHQLGFDHTSVQPSIMETSIGFQTQRSLEQTDVAGAKCSYNKGVISTEEYATACAYAENEGAIGNSTIYLSSTPQTPGCGTVSPPPSSSGQSRLLGPWLLVLILCTLCLRQFIPDTFSPRPER